MYGLRRINNNLAEKAGQRGDFICIGHPEFHGGKVNESWSVGDKWDTRRQVAPRVHLCRIEPLRHGRRSRSTGELVRELGNVEARGTPGERASVKKMASSEVKIAKPPGSGFNSFLADLSAPEGSSACLKTAAAKGSVSFSTTHQRGSLKVQDHGVLAGDDISRTTHSFAGQLGYHNGMRHYASCHDELLELRHKLKENPEATKRDLLKGETWKFYAAHLEQAQRLEAKFDKEKRQQAASVLAFHMQPSFVGMREAAKAERRKLQS